MADKERLEAVSPSLVTAIRRCGLAVFLSRRHRRSAGSAPSSPPARLGAAVHRVLAWVGEGGCHGLALSQLEEAARERWAEEMACEEQAAAAHPAERYFGPATSWPGYATAAERLVVEAARLAAEVAGESAPVRWVERPLSTACPPMRGWPDLVLVSGEEAQVIEFKSGTVNVDDALPSGRYGLQVLLYALMVTEAGLRVAAGEIRPIGRPPFAVELGEAAVDEARDAAIAALGGFNAAIDSREPSRLASPSDRSCAYCPHTLRCPALWEGEGVPQLQETQVIEGVVQRVQRTQVGSVAVELAATAGTRSGQVTLSGLDPRQLSALEELRPGDQIRVSGLHAARRGSTLLARPGSWVQLSVTTKGIPNGSG